MSLNTIAQKSGLILGMRHSIARDLVPTLHTTVIEQQRICAVVEELCSALQTFCPRVEPSNLIEGAFTLDPQGLGHLYGDYQTWAKSVHRYLRARHWRASVGVGFHRHRCLAVARIKRGPWVIDTPQQERTLSNSVSLTSLGLSGAICEDLSLLGVESLGDFLALSVGEIHSRFGAEASGLHRLFDDQEQLPIQARAFEDPIEVSFQLEPPDHDLHRLLFAIKGALHSLLSQSSARAEAVCALKVALHIEHAPVQIERIEPAEPTTDLMTLLELIRLRFGQKQFEGDIEEVVLTAQTERHQFTQQKLLKEATKRDPDAANRALARVRAAYGTHAVSQASVHPAHLPEAKFRWNKETAVHRGVYHATGRPRLIRRLYAKPKPLSKPIFKDDSITEVQGPYRISGGWWKREVERDYYYATNVDGDLLWLFYDKPRKRWYVHGVVD